jgi:hypothetical protein
VESEQTAATERPEAVEPMYVGATIVLPDWVFGSHLTQDLVVPDPPAQLA